MTEGHPMLPQASLDEAAQQLFLRDLKGYVAEQLEPFEAAAAAALDPGEGHNDRVGHVYAKLHERPSFRDYASLRRTSQELLWDDVAVSVRRQAAALDAKAEIAEPKGSLTLAPAMRQPAYLDAADVHLMPGGYADDPGGVAQGALMDRGGAVYMLGRNGGLLNDVRGHTLAAHVLHRWPGLVPNRVLELGCGVGVSTLPIAAAFPQAEVHGLDVGASMLRYAHARAEHLGVAIHFHQGDAEHTGFAEGSFDLVFSCVLMHETSPTAIDAILCESHRLLRPGGVAVHLEVPNRYETMPLWAKIRGEIEHDYNNEPNWKTAISIDYAAAMGAAGFADVVTGFQDSTSRPEPGNQGFGAENKGVFRSWFVTSGRRG